MFQWRDNRATTFGSRAVFTVLVLIVLVAAVAVYVDFRNANNQTSGTTSVGSSTTSQTIQGIITGIVTVGPTQPACQTGSSCTVNMTGYSLEFISNCPNLSQSAASSCGISYYAQLSPSGHYSILLSPGSYEITGLLPTCNWTGCFSTFPLSVNVVAGQQIVVNVNVDTGIR